MSESCYHVKNTVCPKCRELGNDKAGDNLAVYSDGHSWCWSCGYHVSGNGISRFKSREGKESGVKHTVVLPSDSDVCYPSRAIEWVGHYDLTRNDLLNNNVLWSETNQRLIFPVYGDRGLIAYQGRYFGQPAPDGSKPFPKWWGVGDLSSCFNILNKNGTTITLVEDIVSSIKVAKITTSMSLFGSSISKDRFLQLKAMGYNRINIFLDPDKRAASIKFGRLGQLLGINTKIIFSDKDPKELNCSELKILLDFS